VVGFAEGSRDSVDVVVLTKDIFFVGCKSKNCYYYKGEIGVAG